MAISKDKFGFPVSGINNTDAFSRVRVSNPETFFDDRTLYGKNSVDGEDGTPAWYYVNSGSGAASTYNGSDSCVDLILGVDSGAHVCKQSRRYIPYIPGKSQLFQITAHMGPTVGACEKRIGWFDDNNGIYFGVFSGNNLGMGIRNDATGTIEDNIIFQESWNANTIDGSIHIKNESRATLDVASAACIFVCDLQWLAVGTVRTGFMINGSLVAAHAFHHANIVRDAVPYMRTSTLPMRYEIKNAATVTDSHTLKTICSALISEGGAVPSGPTFSAGNDGTLRTGIAGREPILGVRLLDNFLGRSNRVIADFLGATFYAEDQSVYFEVSQIIGVDSTDGTWTQVHSGESSAEFSTDINSIFGGHQHTIIDDYRPAASGGSKAFQTSGARTAFNVRDPFHYISQNYDANKSDLFVVFATSIPGTAAKAATSIQWNEIQ